MEKDIFERLKTPSFDNFGAREAEEAHLKRIKESEDQYADRGNKHYYISQNGDDSNDGLSPEAPFRTISRLYQVQLRSGNVVHFERGSVFRLSEPLLLRGGISYAAYGEGEKPVFSGSARDYADASIWESVGENLWAVKVPKGEVGFVNFNFEALVGIYQYAFEDVKQDGDFYFDREKSLVYLYLSVGNPGEVFENIEISTSPQVLFAQNVNCVNVDNLTIKYASQLGIDFGNNKEITVTNCEFYWVGGSIVNSRPIRYGNAVQFWFRGEELLVKNCYFHQIFDAAVTYQGYNDPQICYFKDIVFEENFIEFCDMNYEFWAGSSENPGIIANVRFNNNTLRAGGFGIGGMQRPDKGDQAFLLGWPRVYPKENLVDFIVENNIFDCTGTQCKFFYLQPPTVHTGIHFKGNSYYQPKGSDAPIDNHDKLPAGDIENFKSIIARFEESPRVVSLVE